MKLSLRAAHFTLNPFPVFLILQLTHFGEQMMEGALLLKRVPIDDLRR